ncbi:hypothetical protein MCR_1334 [Moraxella catarrhalis BBH18]|nr:hypothetical protein MCR_1334 [Moraxella catarrhalis BBH18]
MGCQYFNTLSTLLSVFFMLNFYLTTTIITPTASKNNTKAKTHLV